MPNDQMNDPITDQEIAFAHLLLSGTMTDRQAAKAVGFNPDTAANTKAKPRVSTYMHEHRAGMHQQTMQQDTDEQRRQILVRDRVLACLWKIADLTPDMTKNSMSAQMKALSMIVAIEGLIADRKTDRRAGSAQTKPTPPPVHLPIDTAPWLRKQQEKNSGFQSSPDLAGNQDAPVVTDSAPCEAADAPSHLGSTPAASPVPVSAAPDTQVPAPTAKKPDTWRLRL
jgi:hypothetical protein